MKRRSFLKGAAATPAVVAVPVVAGVAPKQVALEPGGKVDGIVYQNGPAKLHYSIDLDAYALTYDGGADGKHIEHREDRPTARQFDAFVRRARRKLGGVSRATRREWDHTVTKVDQTYLDNDAKLYGTLKREKWGDWKD